ncbi:subtilisin-like protein [Elasticomyces elasticus]|nr:subtilisin-like protein [Elasticomyces elasticus]KAK5735237.1 subtilisin-like protein [Elasticomyces elasticus]
MSRRDCEREKQLAQSNLAISFDFRSGRGDAGASSADQQPISSRGLFRILYNGNKHSRIPGREAREEGEDIIASLANDVDFQRVWDGFGQTYNFYKTVFNRNSIDDQGIDIVVSVRFDNDDRPPGYDDAMWTSDLKQMIFGDGDGKVSTSFTSAIDVIAHELTHGVTDLTANLPYHRQSGALNEPLSDWAAGETVDEADWLIGEGLFVDAVETPALRSMTNPETAFKDVFGRGDDQPSHMDQYEDAPDTKRGDHGGVHFNSGISNRAFYLAAKELGGESKS